MNAWLGSIWPKWNSRRFRIGFYAIVFGAVAGLSGITVPLEDIAINARAVMRMQPAPQTLVVIAIDDRTLEATGARDVTREQEALVSRNLLAAGANRVFFDRSFSYEKDKAGDQAFVELAATNKGRIHVATARAEQDDVFGPLTDVPAPIFRQNTRLVGITGLYHPFDLGVSFPLSWDTSLGPVPGMAAHIAGRTSDSSTLTWLEPLSGLPVGFYRSDYSYDYRTIPTLSFIDAQRGNLDPKSVAGKDVLIGATSRVFNDHHRLPVAMFDIPGVYFHAIASYTFAKPMLAKLGWAPALLVVSIIVAVSLRRGRKLLGWPIVWMGMTLGVATFTSDHFGIEIEVGPAIVTGVIALVRSWSLKNIETATATNIASGLPSFQQFRTIDKVGAGSLIALKLRNYGAIVASFESPVEAHLALEISRRVRLSDKDVVIYHEGDKFLWISPIANPVDILEHLEGLHRLVQGGIVIEEREIDLAFNCGVDIAQSQSIDKRMANALQSAEQAVREDELVCIHDAESESIHWEISMLSALDRAIDSGDVWVAYQPKLDLASGRIKGAEALARWTDPDRGPISPDKFIQIAEEYHRIDRITRFVLSEAVRTARDIRVTIPDFTVSVNISAQLLRFAGLPDLIMEVLRNEGMGPESLVLEITETDRLDRSSKTFTMMEGLVAAGFELSIDDFGTGNATIDYLRFLPAVEVKIDKMFVNAIASDRKDFLLIQSMIEMAHSLDRRVVAEGVENGQILSTLNKLGCDQIQGYHISRPVRSEELLTMLVADAEGIYG